jgi:hypothetical protein
LNQWLYIAAVNHYLVFIIHHSAKNAAWLVIGFDKYEHTTLVLHDNLNWLPVEHQVIKLKFKIATLAFNCLQGTCPAYFRGVCMPLTGLPVTKTHLFQEAY